MVVVVATEEVQAVAIQSLESYSYEPMKHSTLLSEETKKQALLRKTAKCSSSLLPGKIMMAIMAAMDTAAAEQEWEEEETEARMAPMVEILVAIQEGRDQDLTWER